MPNSADHIGHKLRARREALELSLSDASEASSILQAYLRAIETLDTDELPATGYVLGYVRRYARVLSLPEDDIIKAWKNDTQTPPDLGRAALPHFVPRKKIRLPRGFVPTLGVMGLVVMLVSWYGVQPRAEATGSFVESFEIATTPDKPSAKRPDGFVTLEALAPSWIEIRNADGQVIINRIFITGDQWQAPINSGYSASVRDGGAVAFWAGAENLGPLGITGQPVKDFALTAVTNP